MDEQSEARWFCCPAPSTTSRPTAELTEEQRARLGELLVKEAESYGFHGAVWMILLVVVLIKEPFGVTYHPAHCRRLLRAIKYSI